MSIRVKSVETEDEFIRATELFIRVHRVESPLTIEWLRYGSQQYPNFRRDHTFILFYENELVSALRLTTDIAIIGEARLKMGGLGWVSTDERFRGRGLSTRLIKETQHYMAVNNYHVSMLFGIPNFYERLGYVTSLVDYLVEVDTVEAMTFTSTLSMRPARPTDIPAIHRIHSANNLDLSCSILRTMGHLKNRWERWRDWYCLTNGNGKVEAYFIAYNEGSRLAVDDVGVSEPHFCAAVLHAAAKLASDEGADSILFFVPPVHPLARYLLQFRSRHEMRIERNAGGMMAFVNPLETFENMIPEWETLLSKSLIKENKTEFTFCVRDECYRFRLNRGVIDVAALPGKNKISLTMGDMLHLLVGYRYPEDILEFNHCAISPEARQAVLTLFPRRTPYVWRFDRF